MNTPQNDGARPDVAETYLNCHIFFLEHHIYIQLYGASLLYVLHREALYNREVVFHCQVASNL